MYPCHLFPSPDSCSLSPQLEDCALQVSPSGYYLDPELSLEEQREMLEGFYEEIRSELMRPGGKAGPTLAPTRGWLKCQQPRHIISSLAVGHLLLPQGIVPGDSQVLASVTCYPGWVWGLSHIPEILVFAQTLQSGQPLGLEEQLGRKVLGQGWHLGRCLAEVLLGGP